MKFAETGAAWAGLLATIARYERQVKRLCYLDVTAILVVTTLGVYALCFPRSGWAYVGAAVQMLLAMMNAVLLAKNLRRYRLFREMRHNAQRAWVETPERAAEHLQRLDALMDQIKR